MTRRALLALALAPLAPRRPQPLTPHYDTLWAKCYRGPL